MNFTRTHSHHAIAVALLLSLGACGGDDTVATSPPIVATRLISGTAASGAPIIGKVTVKDSLGVQKTVDIEANGNYTVDVTGLTAPFVFRAVGSVGGREISLVSTATAADVGNTVNITPFTDLIVANIAGTAAAKFFDAPTFASLTPANIDSARNQLTARLQPILAAMGVDASFDLLRTAFTANHTSFDAVMDVVKVTVDPLTNKAAIEDLVNQTRIEDDLASRTDTTTIPAPVIPPAATVSDLVAINTVLSNLTALFATSVPRADNVALLNIFSADMLHDGANRAEFLSPDNLLSVDAIGLKLQNAVIIRRDSATQLWVNFSGTDPNGEAFNETALFKKESDGFWRFLGNGRHASINVQAVNSRFLAPPSTSYQYHRNLEFWVDSITSNAIQYVTVTGPGLSAPLGLIRSTSGAANFNVDGYSYTTSWVGDCAETSAGPCVDFSQVTDNAVYTVTYYDHKNGTALPDTDTLTLPRPPVSNADAAANAAAWFATPEPANFLPTTFRNLADGNGITIAWTKPTDATYRLNHTGFSASTTLNNVPSQINFNQDLVGTESSKLVGNWSGPAPSFAPSFWIFTKGPFDRAFATNGVYPGN